MADERVFEDMARMNVANAEKDERIAELESQLATAREELEAWKVKAHNWDQIGPMVDNLAARADRLEAFLYDLGEWARERTAFYDERHPESACHAARADAYHAMAQKIEHGPDDGLSGTTETDTETGVVGSDTEPRAVGGREVGGPAEPDDGLSEQKGEGDG